MKKIAVVILVALIYFKASAQHPYLQPIKQVAAITFPDTPKMVDTTGDMVYSVTVHDIYYFTQVSTIHQSFNDLINASSGDTVYENFIRSSLKLYKGKLLYKNKITVGGVNGIEYGYTAIRDSVMEYRYRQLFYYNNTHILSGVTLPYSANPGNKVLTDFFKTFTVTIRPDQIEQGGSVSVGKSFAYAIGVLLAIALLIAMISGIIAIIKKRLANKAIP